jgi:hypothetical protein
VGQEPSWYNLLPIAVVGIARQKLGLSKAPAFKRFEDVLTLFKPVRRLLCTAVSVQTGTGRRCNMNISICCTIKWPMLSHLSPVVCIGLMPRSAYTALLPHTKACYVFPVLAPFSPPPPAAAAQGQPAS